jgi:DNA gyrase subunit A
VGTYKAQHRGGRGISGGAVREDDFLAHLFTASTHDYLCFFTNKGRAYRVKVHEIPEASRQAKGTAVVNLLPLESTEHIAAVQVLPRDATEGFWVFATKRGVVKRTPLEAYRSWRGAGLIAISLDEDDELIAVSAGASSGDILLGTARGLVIRFEVDEVRPMGRQARGVTGVKLKPDDQVVSLGLDQGARHLLLISSNGQGKRTALSQFRRTGRAGHGIIGMRRTAKTGDLVSIMPVVGDEEMMLISAEGTMIRTPVSSVSVQGRTSQGVSVMRLGEEQTVAAVALIRSEPDDVTE